MYGLFNFLFIISLISVVVWCISRLLYNKGNTPTWNGIIISAIIGMLPCYLFLCFFGILGEKREEDTQTDRRSYTEEMQRRYTNEKPSRKKRNWLLFVVLAFFGLMLLSIWLDDAPQRNLESDKWIESDKPSKEVPSVVKEAATTTVQKSEKPKEMVKTIEVKKQKPLVKQKQNIAIDSSVQSAISVPQEINIDDKADEMIPPVLELPKDINRLDVEKKKDKRTGVRRKGRSSDIWEKVNRRSF